MRTSYLLLALGLGLSLTACSRHDPPHRGEPPARQAGREAYDASQEIKRGAKEAAQEIRKAGKEFREGWSDAKHKDPPKREKPDKPDKP